jgi:hypothetical protein
MKPNSGFKRLDSLMKPILCLIATMPMLALAQSWNAADSFSATQNPNNRWTFGSTAGFAGPFTAFTSTSIQQGIDFWGNNATAAKNNTGSTVNFNNAVNMSAGQLTLAPGTNNTWATARFTTPTSGQYRIAVTFRAVDVVGTSGIDIGVRTPGTTYFSDSLTRLQTKSFSVNVFANAGQNFDFYVGPGPNQVPNGDSVALNATMTAVPEPATLFALGTGLAVLAKRRKSRTR